MRSTAMRRRAAAALVGSAVWLAGCADAPSTAGRETPAVGADPAGPDTLMSPAGFPAAFTTVLPPGVSAEFTGTGEDAAVSFDVAAAAGQDPRAFLHLRFLPEGTEPIVARRTITSFLEGRNAHTPNLNDMQDWPWARAAYTFEYRGAGNVIFGGKAAVSEHAQHPFYILLHYPQAEAAELEPPLLDILQAWRWTDDGTPLIR